MDYFNYFRAVRSCLCFLFGKGQRNYRKRNVPMAYSLLFALCISMALLVKATQTLPIGTAYAVWTGIGAVGTVLMGVVVFKEPTTFLRLLFITTLIGSIIGLKIVSH